MDNNYEMLAPPVATLYTDKIGLIDADFIKYLVTYQINQDIVNKNIHVHKYPLAKYTQDKIDNITNRFNAKGFIFCFSGNAVNTFRSYVAFDKQYKGNRKYIDTYPKEAEDKISVMKYIQERYPTLIYSDLEADDVVSMLQCEDTFVFSRDKDLLQIPGTHYNIKEEKFVEVSKQEAFRFLMTQMLIGDSVDNIGGIKSIGIKRADVLLTKYDTKQLHQVVLQEYVKTYGMFEGIDRFTEAWNLVALRLNRGEYFLSKYKSAFDTLRMIKSFTL